MRRLILCTACHRQYDASKLAPGKRVRCHCGEVIVVPEARGHDAKVVRCSSCGAPRQEGAVHCAHCKSDFTLHELDMQTVCPNCLTRVSDRARFCHSCGGELNAEMIAGETTPLPCPACEGGPRMRSRQLGKHKIAVMECDRCAGLWLGNQTFERLAQRVASQAFTIESPGGTTRVQLQGQHESEKGWQYRKCPECNNLMVRKQYGAGSGIIIDFCRHHGTWFDAQELPAIIAWIRGGGQARAETAVIKKRRQQQRLEQRRAASRPVVRQFSGDEGPNYGGSMWGVLFDVLFEIFH